MLLRRLRLAPVDGLWLRLGGGLEPLEVQASHPTRPAPTPAPPRRPWRPPNLHPGVAGVLVVCPRLGSRAPEPARLRTPPAVSSALQARLPRRPSLRRHSKAGQDDVAGPETRLVAGALASRLAVPRLPR